MDKFQQDTIQEQFANITALLEDASTLASAGQSHSISAETVQSLTEQIEAELQKAHRQLASIKALLDKAQ